MADRAQSVAYGAVGPAGLTAPTGTPSGRVLTWNGSAASCLPPPRSCPLNEVGAVSLTDNDWSNDGFIAIGSADPGVIPASGAGTRLMW